MKWFKHDSDAASDAKIKKLLLRHGAIGYAIYFHCLELIASDLSESNVTFELEHDAEIIADNLKIRGTSDKAGIDIVNEVMHYMVELGLFECSGERITCMKMMKRLDSSMTSNTKFRKLIAANNESHDRVMTESCKKRIEENRTEENRQEENETADAIIDYLNTKAEKRYHHTPANRRPISARLSEGFTDEDCRTVIDNQVAVWKDDAKMNEYLRPATLFQPSKFEGYLNAKRKPKAGGEMVDNGDGTWDYKDVL